MQYIGRSLCETYSDYEHEGKATQDTAQVFKSLPKGFLSHVAFQKIHKHTTKTGTCQNRVNPSCTSKQLVCAGHSEVIPVKLDQLPPPLLLSPHPAVSIAAHWATKNIWKYFGAKIHFHQF